MNKMKPIGTFLKKFPHWKALLIYLGILLLIFIFIFGIIFERNEPEAPNIVFTDYGVFRTDREMLYLAVPEYLNGPWCVTFQIEGGMAVYRYLPNEEEAWTFYSMLRMIYGLEKEDEE